MLVPTKPDSVVPGQMEDFLENPPKLIMRDISKHPDGAKFVLDKESNYVLVLSGELHSTDGIGLSIHGGRHVYIEGPFIIMAARPQHRRRPVVL